MDIGESAFENCNNLTSVTIFILDTRHGDYVIQRFGKDVFNNNAEDRKIFVPKERLEDYKKDQLPQYANDILPIPDKPTSIRNVTMLKNNARDTDINWYSLDGRKYKNKPTEKGVYLHQGRKYMVK